MGAAHVGGGHPGGPPVGGHPGGGHPGGGHPGYHPGGHPGGGYGGYYPNRGVAIGIGLGFGGYGGYGGYYGYPSYGLSQPYGYAVPVTSQYYAAPAVDPGVISPVTPAYAPPSVPLNQDAPSSYSPQDSAGLPDDSSARIQVRAPADAEIWFGGTKTSQTGTVREFVSPPLTPGKEFMYEVRARWMENGKEVVQDRRIDITAGAQKVIDFTRAGPERIGLPQPVTR